MITTILLLLSGEVIIDNLQTGTNTASRSFASTQAFSTSLWAQKVNIQQAFGGLTNTQVSLRLQGSYSGTGSFNVFLAGDIQGVPGSIIGTIGGGNWRDLSTSSTSEWMQSGTTTFAEQQAGQYWIMVQTLENSAVFRWNYGDNVNAGQSAFFNDNNQFWSYPTSNNSLGLYVETVAVPEPGTLILGSLATIFAFGPAIFHMLRKKHARSVAG